MSESETSSSDEEGRQAGEFHYTLEYFLKKCVRFQVVWFGIISILK